MMTMIEDFLNPQALEVGYQPSPGVFGLHDNADITSARNETLALLKNARKTQSGGSSGASRDSLLPLHP